MKRPVLFVALGMVLAFVMLAGVVIITSNALAGTRLREFGNGDIDVNIALSRPTATLTFSGNQSRAGNAANDALHQRDLEYEEKLREVIRMSQSAAPAVMEPTDTATPLPAKSPAPSVTPKPIQPTPLPATLPAIATEKSVDVKATNQPLANTPAPIQSPPQPAQQVAPTVPASDDHGGNRNTPEPVMQSQPPAQQPPPPAPTDDHGGSDNSGPSQSNTPRPPEPNEDSSSNSGRDKPPEPPKEPKP